MNLPRPEGRPSGWQSWRDLLFVHWAVPALALRPLVPAPLELDLWEGRAYVGVVPFVMRDIRPAWVPRFMALDFLETNVRTYVRHRDRPGVFFFSLEASSLLAVKAARWGWGLPYFHARMTLERDADTIAYSTVRRDKAGTKHRVRYRPGRMLGASAPGTLPYFLLERYLLFSLKGDAVYEGQVVHVPYPAQEVEVLELSDELVPAAGLGHGGRPHDVAHFSAGVDVEVFGPWRTS
jgi:uncharacterized protein